MTYVCHFLETYHSEVSTRHHALPASVNVSGEDEPRPSEEEEAAELAGTENEENKLNPRDHVVLTTSCKSISPCIVACGTLTITTTTLYFSLDEEHPDNLKLDPKVSFLLLFLINSIIVLALSIEFPSGGVSLCYRRRNAAHSTASLKCI